MNYGLRATYILISIKLIIHYMYILVHDMDYTPGWIKQ